MRFIKKMNKVIAFTLVLFCSGAVFASAADQNVYVTNWQNYYEVRNNTWDQRLNYIQTATQGTKSDLDTIINRFGFNGQYRLDDALSMIYTEIQSVNSSVTNAVLNLSSSSSAIYNLLNSTFLYGNGLAYNIDVIANRVRGSNTSGPLWSTMIAVQSSAAILNHVDYDLHSVVSNSAITADNTSTIKNITNTNLPAIKVNTDNISVDTENISSKSTLIESHTNSISTYTSVLPNMNIDVHRLKEMLADDFSYQKKVQSAQSNETALGAFTGGGTASASASDYSNMATYSNALKSGFRTNVNQGYALSVLSGSNLSAEAYDWFSQETYDSINPEPTRGGLLNPDFYMAMYEGLENQQLKKGYSDTPLLDDYFRELGELEE